MKIIGYKRSNFRAEDGKEITGYNIYLGYPLSGDDADGMAALQKIYFSDRKLAESEYSPCVGDNVEISYNRFKKPLSIRLISKG